MSVVGVEGMASEEVVTGLGTIQIDTAKSAVYNVRDLRQSILAKPKRPLVTFLTTV